MNYKVFTATRAKPEADEAVRNDYLIRWGIESFKGKEDKHFLLLSTKGTARTLTERIMENYRHTPYHARLTQARGYGINDRKNAANDPVPLLHYLSDALVDGSYSGKFKEEMANEPSVSAIWKNGFITEYERGLKAMLYAQRQLLKEGDYLADALRMTALNEVSGVSFNENDIRASMKAELQSLLPEIPGSVLADLVMRLKTPLPDELLPPNVKPSEALPLNAAVAATQQEDVLAIDDSANVVDEPTSSKHDDAGAILYGQLFSKSFSLQVKGDDGLIYKGRCTCQGGFTVAPGDRVRFSLADIDGCRMIDFIAKEQG